MISASNSYTNNIKFLDKNFVTKCEMYRSGKKDFKYTKDTSTKDTDTKDTNTNIKETTKELLKETKKGG